MQLKISLVRNSTTRSAPVALRWNAVRSAGLKRTRLGRWIARVLATSMTAFMLVPAQAGVDIGGTVSRVHISGDGTLWFRLENAPALETYCQPGWAGLQLYVPRDHADFPYYYGLLMMAASKQKPVYVANISIYNGTTSCDITKTGYGIMLM